MQRTPSKRSRTRILYGLLNTPAPIEAGRLDLAAEPLQVDLLCPLCLRMVAQIALAKRIGLSSAYDSQVQTLVADERRLKQILVNLLSNAVKFTPEGGKVGLELRGNPEEQTVTFTVWDTGIGIAAADLPQLFQPFVQLDNSLSRQHTGTGLGLALVARLTSAHGGSVAVESTPGVGSRFHVTLPWSPAAAPARAAPATTVLPTTRPAIGQAMVIEDSPTAAEQLTRYLHELDARVEVMPYGTGVIERAIALQPDVILLDILLPDDDGWQVLCQLKAEPHTQTIPIIVVSVVDQPEHARTLGAAASLLKPIDRAVLEHTLHRVLVRQADTSIPLIAVTALAMPGDRERCLQAGADDYLTKPVSLQKLVATIEALRGERG